MLKIKNIIIDSNCQTKDDVFKLIAKFAFKNKISLDEKSIYNDLWTREKEASTGFEDGFAIPHARTNNIKKTTVLILRFRHGIEWDSIDGKPITDAFALLVNENDAKNEHIKILSSLAVLLMDKKFVASYKKLKNEDEILAFINDYLKQEKKVKNLEVKSKKSFVGVTACAAGIAHTYMAEKALLDTGTKMGYKVRIETQGSVGAENKLTAEEIKAANFVLIATDIKVDLTRFEGKKIFNVNIKKTLQNTEELIIEASKKATVNHEIGEPQEKVSKDLGKKLKGKKSGNGILRHIMSGISYMIPLLVASGILVGIAKISMLIAGGNTAVPLLDKAADFYNSSYGSNGWLKLCFVLNQIGGLGLSLMYVIFAMFVAYSIADKPGIIPGFLAGFMSIGDKVTTLLPQIKELFPPGSYPYVDLPSGFLGSLLLAFFAGYLVKFLNIWIKVGKNFQAIKPMLILPAVGSLMVIVMGLFVFNPAFGLLNHWLQELVKQTTSIAIVYALIIAGLTAFDLGGPVNKAAGAIAIGMAADHILPLTARVMAIIIPPIGLGMSTILDKYVTGRRVYDKELTVAGRTSFGLGFLAISEGGLPFLFKNPIITISINVVGSMLGSVTAVLIGAEQWQPLPAIWGWPLVEGNIWGYYVGLLLGVSFICFVNIYVRLLLIKAKKMSIDNDEVWRRKTKEQIRAAKKLRQEKKVLKKEKSKNQPKLPIKIKNEFVSFHKWTVKSLKRTFSND